MVLFGDIRKEEVGISTMMLSNIIISLLLYEFFLSQKIRQELHCHFIILLDQKSGNKKKTQE